MLKRKKEAAEDFASSSSTYVKEMVGGFVAGFMRSMTDNLVGKVRIEVTKVQETIQRNIMGTLMLFLGLAFALTGLAIFINDLVQISDGIGFALVGIVALLMGYITIKQ